MIPGEFPGRKAFQEGKVCWSLVESRDPRLLERSKPPEYFQLCGYVKPLLWLLTAQNQLLSFVTAMPEVLFPPNLFMALPWPVAPSASPVWCHQLIPSWVMEPANSSHSFSMPEARWSLRIPWYLPDKHLQPPTFVISTGGGWYLY